MKRKIYIFAVVLLVPAVLVGVFWRKQINKKSQILSEEKQKQEESLAESINGVLVYTQISTGRPMAIIIENHPDARPQSGLSSADIVYEALAEGGITRFLAVFQTAKPAEIGPIRSAREYFASLANEWGALFVHVGGSNEVINQLKNNVYKNLSDANEYYFGDYFIRRKDKPQPHHIFSSTDKLEELATFQKISSTAQYQSWKFKDDQPASTTEATSNISIDFSRAGYEVGWQYNSSDNSYNRMQYFLPHLDAITNKQISAKTVVVQVVKVTPVPKDPLLSVDIDLTSGGKAYIFLDGRLIEGEWKNAQGKTRFYDNNNQEISFNRGSVWIEMVPEDKENGLIWK